VRSAGKSDNRLSAFIVGVATSAQFKMAAADRPNPRLTDDAGDGGRSSAR
jgi:hypothetical protein